MATQDELIGANVARFRGDRSQASIAEEMKSRGWKWSQSTVWSIEKGDRPLRLAEAADLASILGRDVAVLIRNDAEAYTIEVAWAYGDALDHVARGVWYAKHRREILRRSVHGRLDGFQEIGEDVQQIREEALRPTIEDAIAEGMAPSPAPPGPKWGRKMLRDGRWVVNGVDQEA